MAFLSFLFYVIPLTLIALFIKWKSGDSGCLRVMMYVWTIPIALFILSWIIDPLFEKKSLEKKDYYGDYIIDRDYFPGKQTDWQYNHFRFTITATDSIYFYYTDGEYELITYWGTITTTDHRNYASDRLIINMEQPNHHILTSNPTTYRNSGSFNLVFYSPKFNNVYFKKGKWEPIDD